jgi:hypothetical protein
MPKGFTEAGAISLPRMLDHPLDGQPQLFITEAGAISLPRMPNPV